MRSARGGGGEYLRGVGDGARLCWRQAERQHGRGRDHAEGHAERAVDELRREPDCNQEREIHGKEIGEHGPASSATLRVGIAQPALALDLAAKARRRPEVMGGRSVYARGKGMIAACTS